MGVSMMAVGLEQAVASSLANVPAVERVYVNWRGDSCNVVTIINEEDESAYDNIYDHERGLIHANKSVRFDFHVVARRGRPIHEVAGYAAPVWDREETNKTTWPKDTNIYNEQTKTKS